jgi:hypothetical protein
MNTHNFQDIHMNTSHKVYTRIKSNTYNSQGIHLNTKYKFIGHTLNYKPQNIHSNTNTSHTNKIHRVYTQIKI